MGDDIRVCVIHGCVCGLVVPRRCGDVRTGGHRRGVEVNVLRRSPEVEDLDQASMAVLTPLRTEMFTFVARDERKFGSQWKPRLGEKMMRMAIPTRYSLSKSWVTSAASFPSSRLAFTCMFRPLRSRPRRSFLLRWEASNALAAGLLPHLDLRGSSSPSLLVRLSLRVDFDGESET